MSAAELADLRRRLSAALTESDALAALLTDALGYVMEGTYCRGCATLVEREDGDSGHDADCLVVRGRAALAEASR